MMDQTNYQRIAGQLPVGRDPASVRRRIEAMEGLLERAFAVPGTEFPLRHGFGRRPGARRRRRRHCGDGGVAGLGSRGISACRKFQIARMTGNVAFDTAVGFVPLLGDAFDFLFKSNTRNLRIVKRWLDKHHPGTRTIEGEVLTRRDS
jgi:hypothetical protein